jgi:hypothetical protein
LPIKTHDTDILSHVITESTLASKVASVSGSITLLYVFKIEYRFTDDQCSVSAIFQTPFGDVNLGKATLTHSDNTATLSGNIDGFKGEVSFELDFNKLTLKICGKACAPFAGCTSGCITIHF